MSLGGHGDLPRTLRYLCTGSEPDGAHRPPHDYGVVIILLGVADRVVPADQVAALREALLTFLEASRLDLDRQGASRRRRSNRRARSTADAAGAVADVDGLRQPARRRRSSARPAAARTALGGDPALSPDASPPPAAPVFLLHGADDNVIPAAESILLARDLARTASPVHVLATPLITHAEVDRGVRLTTRRLIAFWRTSQTCSRVVGAGSSVSAPVSE